MKTKTGLLAMALSSCLLFACGGSKDDKKGADEKSDKDEKAGEGGEKKTDETSSAVKKSDTASEGNKKLPGNFGALLAGGGKKKVNDTMKGTGLGLGSILGGLGGGAAASGTEPDRKAPAAEPVASPPASPAKTAPVASGGGGECGKIADHVIALALAEMGEQVPPEYKQQMVDMMADARNEIVTACASFPADAKQCILQAKTIEGMGTCEQMAMGGGGDMDGDDDDGMYDGDDGDDGDYYDEPAATPVGDPPKWDGKDKSCTAVGNHMVALMMWMYSGDADAKASMEPMLKELTPQMVEMCATGKWPEAARVCILKAQSEDDMNTCSEMLGM